MRETTRNYTYILKCGDGSLYTGWTNDIAARLEQHRSGKGAKYTRGRGPLQLVYLEVHDTRSEAMSREARIKRFTKSEKLKLLAAESWRLELTDTEQDLLEKDFVRKRKKVYHLTLLKNPDSVRCLCNEYYRDFFR